MATDQVWTSEALSDEIWAFGKVVDRASDAKLNSAELDSLRRIKEWVARASPIAEKVQAGATDMPKVPPMDLTPGELHALVVKLVVKSGGSASQRRRLAGQWRPVERFHRQLGWLAYTSGLIAITLGLAAAINVIDLVWLKEVSRTLVIGTNLTTITAVYGVWAVHHFISLRRHAREFDAHLMAAVDQVAAATPLTESTIP